MKIDEIDTPAVLIEADILYRNLRKMAEYCGSHHLSLRPYTKTHKIPEIAKLQVQYGATGITVAKLGEAEVTADAGIRDTVVVYPLWGENKWRRLAALAERIQIAVTIDSLPIAAGISKWAREAGADVGIRLEFDTGFGRCGLPIEASSVEVARRIRGLPNLRWEGISFYLGHIMGNRAIREHEIEVENSQLDRLLGLLDFAAVLLPVVSGGNTPAAFESHRFHGVAEIRPGTYVFNDRNTVEAEAATYADCAAIGLATVVSTSVHGSTIIDAGSKMFSGDPLLSGERKHYGYVRDHPDLPLEDLSEEHDHLRGNYGSVHAGDRVRVVPNHIRPCINLQNHVYLVSGDEVIERWKVAARGMAN